MLYAIPKNVFSENYFIQSDSEKLTQLHVSILCDKINFTLDGNLYKVYRKGLFKSRYIFQLNNRIIVKAVKKGLFRDSFNFSYNENLYSVHRDSSFKRKFSIYKDSKHIGTIRPFGTFSEKAYIDLPFDFSIELQMFIFCVVLNIWNMEKIVSLAAIFVVVLGGANS